jgi:hypothetical protein
MREWVASRSDEIRYNEPGGSWMLRHELIFALHDEHRSSRAADEIAWFAVTNGLPADCEGHLVCYLEVIDKLQGEYLRREPGGSHIEEAAARISWVVEDQFSAGQSRFYFEPQRDCDALAEVISSLETALSDSRVLRRTELVGQLRQKLTLCP